MNIYIGAPQETEEPPVPFMGGEDIELWSNMLQVIIVLIVIIGLILLLVKLLAKRNSFFLGNRAIRLLGGVQLGQNKSLQMLRIGSSIYVVGLGENVQLLDKIVDESEIDYILDLMEQEQERGRLHNFKFLASLLKRKEHEEVQQEQSSASFQEIFHQKMGRVSNRSEQFEEIFAKHDGKRDGKTYD